MLTFSGTRARETYMPEMRALLNSGEIVKTRGRETRELLDVYTMISGVSDHCILLPARRWNPWLALSEFLWIAAGRNDLKALMPYNSIIEEFSDDRLTLYGAYGRRLYGQIDDMIGRLRQDPNDRRAVLSIWEARDLTAQSKDPPCNNLLYFKLRDGRLNMTVICRSNDLHWGLYAVNIPTFGLLQEYIASRLGVELGWQAHLSNSLHIYTDDKRANAITERMMNDFSRIDYPAHGMAFEKHELEDLESHAEFAKACNQTLEDGYNELPFLKFASDFLTMYKERKWQPELLDDRFADWKAAAQLFAQQMWK